MENLLPTLVNLFRAYGYPLVFFGVMLENAGIPLPGETIVLLAGFSAFQGHLALAWVIVLAALGASTGDSLGYWLGSRGGRPFLERFGRYLLITPARLAAAERYFQRHGPPTVFLARFIAGLRVLGAFLAGVSHMPYAAFLTYNLLGAATWATAMGLAGYYFGHGWRALTAVVKRLDLALFIVAALVVGWLLFRRWQAGRRSG
jgi:membrane protein DedA with SNARE-associated domain